MKGITVHAKTVEAGFAVKTGNSTLVCGNDPDARCWVDLWADITPTGFEEGDYEITRVFLGCQADTNVDELSGAVETQAKAILLADEDWRQWAYDEICALEAA